MLTELGDTLQTCTSCHAAWKQQVVDEPTWARFTATPAPTGHGGHRAMTASRRHGPKQQAPARPPEGEGELGITFEEFRV